MIPLGPRTARAIDLPIGERCEEPMPAGQRLDRQGAGRIIRRVARRPGPAKKIRPHTLRHPCIAAALDAGVPLRDVQEAGFHAGPPTTTRYDRARVLLDRHANYTPTSPEQPARPSTLRLGRKASHFPETRARLDL